MYTKIIAFIIQTCVFSKALLPPNPNLTITKVMSTEGLAGILLVQLIPKLTIVFNIMQSLFYIYIMRQQEIGSVPILPDENHKFSEWNLLEIVCCSCTVGGSLLRLLCFKTLKEYFTFNVTIKENHKLITTGPYSLLVHPAYTGGVLMLTNYLLLGYQLCSYIPVYLYFSIDWNKILFNLWFVVFAIVNSILMYRRITYEEMVLKKHFDKEWDVYFSQRKRFIPYFI